jgi:drug/metabolite transporter (DMT)-like permease
MNTLTRGLLAGAAGTLALDVTTYLDMAVRGRPASRTPEQTVQRLADIVRLDLGTGDRAESRRTALGALLGYATGLGVALGYTLAVRRPQPVPVTAGLLTVLAMTGANGPMTLLGITDPRTWKAIDWVADVVPHLAYGVVAGSVARRLR